MNSWYKNPITFERGQSDMLTLFVTFCHFLQLFVPFCILSPFSAQTNHCKQPKKDISKPNFEWLTMKQWLQGNAAHALLIAQLQKTGTHGLKQCCPTNFRFPRRETKFKPRSNKRKLLLQNFKKMEVSDTYQE